MRRLLIADIHANLPAFRAVLEAAASWDEAWFLGDVVGWGPHPAQCVDLLREMGARCVAGNHDRAIAGMDAGGSGGFAWDRWTRDRLDEGQLRFLRGLDDEFTHEDAGRITLCVHQPPAGGYLHPALTAGQMEQAFAGVDADRVLCGHCHHLIERNTAGKSYCCLRSAGQPRDGDPRAGYAVEQDGRLCHLRVRYDVDRLLRDAGEVGLEPAFFERWSRFAATGYDPQWSRPGGR